MAPRLKLNLTPDSSRFRPPREKPGLHGIYRRPSPHKSDHLDFSLNLIHPLLKPRTCYNNCLMRSGPLKCQARFESFAWTSDTGHDGKFFIVSDRQIGAVCDLMFQFLRGLLCCFLPFPPSWLLPLLHGQTLTGERSKEQLASRTFL